MRSSEGGGDEEDGGNDEGSSRICQFIAFGLGWQCANS